MTKKEALQLGVSAEQSQLLRAVWGKQEQLWTATTGALVGAGMVACCTPPARLGVTRRAGGKRVLL